MFNKISSLLLLFIVTSFVCPVFPQTTIDSISRPPNARLNRFRGLIMLDEVKDLIKQKYYDRQYRGIDIDKLFKIAKEKVKTLDSNWEIFRVIAQVVMEFNDSHTRFYPLNRKYVEYGFSMQMIGNNCFVTNVKKGSDAETKGLKIGDVIVRVGNFNPTRENLWKMKYLLYDIDPQESIILYVLNPDKTSREIEILSTFGPDEDRRREAEKLHKEKKENPYKCQKINTELIACKLETFLIGKKFIDKMIKEIGGYEKLILDLRGNGGGYVDIEEYLTGHFFDRDVKIADFVMRDKTKERIAKTQKEKVFKGDLIVMIDSQSASASEVFARVIQLEKRGKIVGDVSAGAVMTGNFVAVENARGVVGREIFSIFAMNITIADLIMSDGKRLENVGVIPDYPVGPTGRSLFDKSDPVLAYSAGLLGAKINDVDAGKFYFLTKKPENEDPEDLDEEEN